MASDTAIGAVDLTQIIGIAKADGVNRLTGGRTYEAGLARGRQITRSACGVRVGTYTA